VGYHVWHAAWVMVILFRVVGVGFWVGFCGGIRVTSVVYDAKHGCFLCGFLVLCGGSRRGGGIIGVCFCVLERLFVLWVL